MDYGTFLLCYYVIGYDLLGLYCVFAYVGMLCKFSLFGGEGEAFFFQISSNKRKFSGGKLNISKFVPGE